MSVTSGFFNSMNSDRKYNAEQMSAIFDGVINDGVFANIGTAFAVSANTGFQVNVGIGRAWFNSKWLYNDTILPLTIEQPEVLLNRIDAVVIEIDSTEEVRAGSIKIVKGTPASTPQNPALASSEFLHQYPLAYILVEAGVTSITQSKITNKVGTSDCPYVTGILQVVNIDNIVAQWGAQWIEWFAAEQNLGNSAMQQMLNEWNAWFAGTTTESETEIATWTAQMKNDFLAWYDELQAVLDDNVAAALTAKVVDIEADLTTLAQSRVLYTVVTNKDNDEILDSLGSKIEGKTVFSGGGGYRADTVSYDNDASSLHAHSVQGALDELADRKNVVLWDATAFASDWSADGVNNVSVIGLTDEFPIAVGVADTATDTQWEAATNAGLRATGYSMDHLTLKATGSIPQVDIPILIYIWPNWGV